MHRFKPVHYAGLLLAVAMVSSSSCNHQVKEVNQAEGKVSPAEGKVNPAEGKVIPAESKVNPAEGKVNPAEGKVNQVAETDSHVAAPEEAVDAGGSHVVRAEYTVAGTHIIDAAVEDIHEVEWMESRRQAQLATAGRFNVFHDFQFVDRQTESGILFRNYAVDCSTRDYKGVHYDHGNGVAIADVDNDGRFDIYFTTQVGGNELWRNLGDGKFENITDAAGVALADRISVTASFADTDNDGDADLYVTTVRGGNVLFENDGAGNFRDISDQSGLGYRGHSSSAVFFDYDRDGLLDVFLTNVGTYTTDEVVPATAISDGGYSYYLGLRDGFAGHLKPERAEQSILWKNTGGNRFRDVSEEMNLVDTSWTGAASPIDGNSDGWPDLYVLNMQGHDEYYENDQGSSFIRKSRDVFPKTSWGAMGIKVFDYNNDGRMDIFITDMHSDMSQIVPPGEEKAKADMIWPESFLVSEGQSIFGNTFYRANEDGSFDEVSDELGAENFWPWGLSVGDLNADGYEDVFIASCMNYPFRYGVNSVLLNNRGQQFLDSEFILGVEPRRDGRTATPCFQVDAETSLRTGKIELVLKKACETRSGTVEVWGTLGSRASVIFDLDNDGDLDIVTNDFHSEPMVLVSDLSDQKDIHFLKVRLVGTKSNRDGLGSKVTVHTKSGAFTKNHDGQSGYLSQSRCDLYFGLGDDDSVERVEVTWPTGQNQVVSEGIVTNSVLTVTEE
jgi:uncharacterized protein YjbJ (UPF0337 family)